jgi:hypothetical protein
LPASYKTGSTSATSSSARSGSARFLRPDIDDHAAARFHPSRRSGAMALIVKRPCPALAAATVATASSRLGKL